MKIERVESKFRPVVITLENQEEVDQMYAIANDLSFDNNDIDITNTLFEELSDLPVVVYYTLDGRNFTTKD